MNFSLMMLPKKLPLQLKLLLKYWFTLCILVFSLQATAKPIELLCVGKTYGTNIKTTSFEIDLTIEEESGEIYDFPIYKAMGCSSTNGEVNRSCDKSEPRFRCSCSNNLGYSIIEVSRISGKLNIQSVLKSKKSKLEENWTSEGTCQLRPKKKF